MSDDGVSPVTPRAELPPEDRPPEPGRREIPRGLLWALALAVVVLLIASWVALDAEQKGQSSSEGVVTLDRNQPAGGIGLRNDFDLVGQRVPEVTYTRFSGGNARLTDLRGTPVVLNFWRSDCKPCITEMPALERLHRRYGEQVRFVGVASNDGEQAARDLATRTGVTFDLGLDPSGAVAKAFGVIGLPSTALIDRDGTVVWFTRVPKEVQEAELARAIDEKLLA